MLYQGINKIFWGLLYKFVIAFQIKLKWMDVITTSNKDFLSMINYMYAYSFYLFFDFAGYSMFAIGFSYIFGVKTPENFNKPFLSVNIRDFWNRWHMSLSHWFRDFVFMSVATYLIRRKLGLNNFQVSSLAYITSFGLMGIWHGLAFHYLIYGFYHAFLCIAYEYYISLRPKAIFNNKSINTLFSRMLTLHLVGLGLLIFSGKII
jgi:membrane protein involved in D-alanine export